MIQRIQHLWLLIAALVAASLFYFNYYHFSTGGINIKDNYVAIILTGISVLLSLYTIFMFKNRKLQGNLIWLNIFTNIALLAWLFVSISNAKSEGVHATDGGTFSFGAFIPVITLVFLFIARSGVRKDEKLIKSLNRLR